MEQALLGAADRVLEEVKEGASTCEVLHALKQAGGDLKDTLDLLRC
jgi:hypothetical protein